MKRSAFFLDRAIACVPAALAAGVLMAATLAPSSAAAQPEAASAYPARPIRLVVPYAAGGGADNAARAIVPALSKQLGQSVVVDNRAGASGAIGAGAVAQAQPDGYTVLYDASTFAVNPVLRKLPFDALADFIPVTQAVSVPNVMVVATNSPYQSATQFLDAARASPGKLTYASYGAGSTAHLIGELLKREAKLDIVHVPYKGGAPALVDVMGGQVDTYFANAASSLGFVREGKLRALAVTSRERHPDLPQVPTIAELGFPGFEVLEWNGFFVPKGTPPEVVERLSQAIHSALKDDAVRDRLLALGLTPVGSSADQFQAFIRHEMERWRELARTNAITAQ